MNKGLRIKVKEAQPSDSDLVFNLTKQAFQDYNLSSSGLSSPALQESREDVLQDIEQGEILIAYLHNQPAGSVRFYAVDEGEFYLSRLGVLAKYRGKGVGSTLISAVESRVRAKGGQRITLYSAYHLENLLNFYLQRGYQIVGVKEGKDYNRAIISKELSNEVIAEDKGEEYEVVGR
ncbi:GNAT family N-acetyltransferase [Fuchsiella alkaliacetigena]|uniref:GNAT family N-acetyltransferase n=1 Tax=Fuchsiella alkaliacetigena TaxID=957042 RepID=UPI00200A3E86|nr:GNAT family N-acetyltransferase [Fuchsiella alkaliacetigena]MCK8824952.1 GNAT family N-acetyltransferase [Fuchsiella alkaliacetigena]